MTLGLIPARGGSKGIPRKNIRPLDGEPLIAHTIRAALRAETIDRTVVSTDDDGIRDIARKFGADTPFLRPTELATDEAPTEPVLKHALTYLSDQENEKYDDVVLLQPTSPLRDATHVDRAVKTYRESGADSLVSVSEDHSYRWRRTDDGAVRKNYTGERKRRQDKEPEFVENGAIYIADSDAFLETGNLQVGQTTLYVMEDKFSIDIDEPFDLWLAERILEWQQNRTEK